MGAADLRARAIRDRSCRGRCRGARRHDVRRAHRGARSSWPSRSSDAVPSVEKVRFVSSGTEAAMTAVRLARARHRPRPRSSSSRAATTATPTRCSSNAGSGVATLGIPGRPGVPPAAAADTIVLPLQRRRRGRRRVRRARRRHRVRASSSRSPANMGVVPPGRGFLAGAARALRRHGRAAGLRRGDHGLPRRPRGRAGAVRRHARPDRPGQGHRRRAAGRRPSAGAPT